LKIAVSARSYGLFECYDISCQGLYSVSFLVLKKSRFKISGRVLTPAIFREWIGGEGRLVLHRTIKSKKWGWFFGGKRARRTLYIAAKHALHPNAPFSVALEYHLNMLPVIIRKIGLIIKRKGLKDLYSADSSKALLVIPRGVVQHDFAKYLLKKLENAPQLSGLWQLSSRVLLHSAVEAERIFFEFFTKGRTYPDPEARGVFMGVDQDFAWKLNGVNGHYYFAYYGKRDDGLTKKSILKRFKTNMGEVLTGQEVHLRRLKGNQIVEIAETFRSGK
jgi:hypothetical protein